jgi:predicted  nucleic acid-binding Zn-ribbon protein
MSDVQQLYQLQELDLQSEAQVATLSRIAAGRGESPELSAARAEVERLRGLLHEQEQRLRELEWDVDQLNDHLGTAEQKLYGGRVHNPKELEGLQHEVERGRARRGQIEDRELQLMGEVEATQAAVAEAVAELARVRDAWEAQQRDLAAQEVEANEQVAALRARRALVAATIDAGQLALYEQLRREKQGRALSRVERGTCLGCRIALPLGLIQRARAGREFVPCPSCGRLLCP